MQTNGLLIAGLICTGVVVAACAGAVAPTARPTATAVATPFSATASPSPAPTSTVAATATGSACTVTLLHERSDRKLDYQWLGNGFKPNMPLAPPLSFQHDGVEFWRVEQEPDGPPEETGTDKTGSFRGGGSLGNESIPAEGGEWKVVASDGTCTAETTFDPYEFD